MYTEGENGELDDNEVLSLAVASSTFSFLDDKEEDIYTRFDGQKITIKLERNTK